jgi:hypothetical protein
MGYSTLYSGKYYTRWHDKQDKKFIFDWLDVIYDIMDREGYLNTVIYDKEHISKKEFLDMCDDGRLLFILFRKDATPLGLVWFTNPSATGKQVFAHFTSLNLIPREESVEAGKELIRFLYDSLGIEQLIGVTPKVYRHALQFAYDMGYEKVAILDKAVFCRGKERDAVLSICNTKPRE